MTPSALHAKMLELFQRYKDALECHALGRAGLVRDEAAVLLATEWEIVLAALDDWAHPLSHGCEPGCDDVDRAGDDTATILRRMVDHAFPRGTTVGYGHDYSIEDEPAMPDTYGDWRDNEPPEPGASA